MANQKIAQLPAASAIADTTILEVTTDPSGTPASEKATAAQLAAYVQDKTSDLTEATSMDEASDFMPARVGGNSRKVAPRTAFQALHGLSAQSTPQLQDEVMALDGSASWAAFRTTVEGILNAIGEAETTTYPSDPLVMMHDDGNNDPIAMPPQDVVKGMLLALSAFASTIAGADDLIIYYDQSAGALRAITPDQLGQVRQSVFIPAAAWLPRTTSGPARGSTELSTNKIMVPSLDYDASAQEYAQFAVWLPKSWDLSNLAYRVAWTTATGTGGVTWSLAARAYSDDDALDQAMGTPVLVADTRIADNDLHISPESGALSAAGSAAEMDLVIFELSRAVADGGDTKTGDARMLGVHLYYNTRVRSDA